MPSASLLIQLLSVLLLTFVFGETEIRFAGQTEFVVNETSTTVIRLIIERIGEPANVTAIVSLYGEDTGDFFDTYAAVFIPAEETNRTAYIAVCDDDLPEPDETFIFHLTLQKPSASVKLGWPRTVTVTILSNDNAFGIISFDMPSSITVSEPRGRNESVPLTLIREKGTYGMVTVTFEVEGGPNPPEEDLSPVRGNISFLPGRATVTYNLTVLDDEIPENDEVFLILLKNLEGGAEINTSRNSVEIIIKKNDGPVRFVQSVYLVPEEDHILIIPVVRGKDNSGNLIGSDEYEVSIKYTVITGNSTAHAQQNLDFIDLQPNTTIVFPPFIHEAHLKFQIVDDEIPEIAESFHIMLLKDTLQGDAVLIGPSIVQVTIKPNDKPHGVLSFNSILFERPVIIDEDTTLRFEDITVVRNGGTHGNVSVNWVLTRNSSDSLPVTADIRPSSGVLHFTQGQMVASIPLTIVNDDVPEEAEAYLLTILPHTIQGGAEVSEPAELLFYIQDSDDVYGLITFFPMENQKIESSPGERYLSLSFTRLGGTKGDLRMLYSALYIPAGVVDPMRAKDGILNTSRRNSLMFPEHKTQVTTKLPIRNDAFLQNGAHFLIQLESVALVNILPPIPPVSPRFGEIRNISLLVTPAIANGEIGFISSLPIILHEPEDSAEEVVYIPLHRDGTDGQATVYWSLKPSGFNSKAVTVDDLGPFNGSVVFLSGQSDTTINITVKGDDIPEMNETVTLSLDSSFCIDRVETERFVVYFGVDMENQVLKSGYMSRDLVILENDDPGGVFEFSPTSRGPYVVKEGESVELHIIRSRGALVKQFLHYQVEPRDSNEFYGNTGVLEFKPGEREIVITLLTRLDGIPELDEHYWVILSSHGERESKLGSATVVNITILKNDDPHGIIEFVSDGLTVTINESKGDNIHHAVYGVIRNRGNFGNVSVSWVVSPDFTQDVFPVQGIIFFGDQQFSKNITIYSLPDEIPEEMEEFTIFLFNATGGARLGNKTTAILMIRRNDDPIYFAEPRVVRVQEGETANFTVLRNGSVDAPCTVQYATRDGKAMAKEGDFVPVEGETLIFEVGSREQSISVYVNEDGIPETDESFYVILFNSTGDTVVYQYGIATVIIEANDDPNGIFSLEPIDKAVEEGRTNAFWIWRQQGHFGNVSVAWQLFQNHSILQHGQEFYETSGTVHFMDGEEAKPIILHAFPDNIPEFNEFYILRLINISGGSPGPGGQLADTNLQVTVMIPFNDDPFGIFILDPECLEREVAEDVLSEDDMSYITNFTILRQQGVFGDVRVGWEILSSEFTAGLPPMIDFLLVGVFPSTVHLQPHMRRHHSGTDALYFSGLEGAFGTVNPKYHPFRNNTIANFTFSAWVMPNANTNGFVIAKDDGNGSIYYGVKIQTNESHVTLSLHYKTLGSNATYIAKATVMKYLEEGVWLHLLIILDDGIIEFYLDGNAMPRGIKSLKGEAIVDGPGVLRIGAGPRGNERLTGLMQDVRAYERKLTLEEIYELHAQPAKSDLHPISGYLEFRQGETNKSFIVSARDDNEEEGEELFILKLVSVYGGAQISEENTTARLIIQKSDNANGLFGFTGACIPEIAEEGATISCVVERTRGALDYVHVFYTISQIESDGINYLVDDFANASGTLTFLPWQRSEVLNIYVLDDDIPELDEYFRVTLVSAIPGDGKLGSTPTSGASIDLEKETTDIAIKASDHPYGLLQFSTGLPPQPEDAMSLPESSMPHITVQEEDGEVRLLVVRAQGLLGRVSAEFRTVSLTAFSPQDYQNVTGTLEFQPGERYKYIFVNITDNSIPELEKSFKVELLNLEGGVTELFRVDGSGSGDGDLEFFFPTIHKHASLGVASQILVTIAASDHAHGVFEFSPESLFVNGTEPEDGFNIVILKVVRSHGTLSRVTLCWSIDSDPDGDLAFTSGNITFEIGQTSAHITVEILPDEDPELDKEFSVSILSVSSGSLGVHTNATLTVLASDDPYGVFIFSEKNRPIEVEEATQNVTLSIVRLKGLMGKVMVSYATVDDMEKPPYFPPSLARATQGRDYISASGFAFFGANQSEATVTISILDDDEPERSESVFIELLHSTLIEKVQRRPILNSPRLGPKVDTIAHLIILANDDAFGILQLSAPIVRVAENHVGPIINVTRTGGAFADVSVKFKAVPITAVAGEDYSIASSDVVLLEGETSKAVPIYIINDIYPELDESFLVQLLNETTGGAKLGTLTEAVIIIEASDDPYGLFGFQITKLTVEEPEFNSVKVNLPIIRNSGTLGNVTVQWVATINGQLATGDLRVVSGNVTFAPGETIQTLLLEVLADDVPEIEEVIQVQLTDASGGGTIGLDRVANIIIPANDNPYGTVAFVQSVYRVQEPLERSSCANITVRRSGGHFGRLLLFYSTSDIDVVALAAAEGEDLLSYYESPIQGVPDPLWRTWVNVSAVGEPQYTCATLCLKEYACLAFSFSSALEGPQCFWMTSWISPTANNISDFWTYRKNMTRVASLFSGQAVAGSDYEPVTRQWATMLEGDEFANLTVSILPDDFPEMDESFLISLLEVHLMNITATLKNQPTIGQPNTSTVVIALNGDAFGVFVIYSISPNTSEDGSFVEVQEQPLTSVELVIHRTGGSLGQVTVEWRVVGGTATEGLDFIGAGDILTFAEGETKKTAILTILDDSDPEDDESIVVSLVYTEGGSRILPSSDTVRVNILANDNVAGIVSFQTASRSVIGHEGEILQFHVIRTPPGRGNVTVDWKIIGQNLELSFANFTGQLFFPEGTLNQTIFVHLLDDNIPEEKEVYQVILYDVRTQGVPPAGIALLDTQGYAAVLTIEASDEPHGVINFALSSRFVLVQEANATIRLFINREFGSLGAVNVTYTTVPGVLSLRNQTEGNQAEPEVDFVPIAGFLILEEGETTAAIHITILEDDIPELEEYFLVNLTHVELIMAPLTSFPPRLDAEGLTAQIIIDANDGARGIIEWQKSRFEVNEAHGSVTLEAERRGQALGQVSLFVYAQNLEAQLGLDYIFTPMILHFADGERSKSIDIMILDDDIPEGDEKFQLILTNPSPGLELGQNTIALITVLANDDGPGVLSFNNSEQFFLREPTALYVQESVAVLYIVREPTQGLFGTVTVQFIVTEVNSSTESKDLTPSKGYIVFEEGVRFKALHISAILDTEPEMDEHFVCTLFNPTGGARLGVRTQTLITILQNQAPLGLFSIFAVENRATSLDIEEANRTVYLNVSRTNGLDLAVSVQWETISETAFGMRGMDVVFSTFQHFSDEPASAWCFFTLKDSTYGIMLQKSSFTVYRWQGVFIPVENSNIKNPKICEAFNIGLSPYFVITHEEKNEKKSSVNSVYTFTSGFTLFLVQRIIISESSQVKYFTSDSQDYLIIASQRDDANLTQVYRWDGQSFVLHQKLPVRGVLAMALFNRGGSMFLVISQANARLNALVLRWSGSWFINFQEVLVSGTTQVEALSSGDDTYLIFSKNIFLGNQNSIEIFIWETGQSSFRYFQSLDFATTVNRIHSFTPASGIVHVLLIGQEVSALYCWDSELNQFSFVLEAPSASDATSVTVKSLNASKNLIAVAGATHSHMYELAYISSQSDFIPSSGELIFEPGDREATIAVNILDDVVPEEEESFKVQLKHPTGGAEIGINGYVKITILSNDDAYGVIAFAQNSLYRQVEEMERDSLVTLNVERFKGTYRRVTVAWEADGSISDIFPTSGVISFTEGQALSTITLTVLTDDIPELSEVVTVTLTQITTEGVADPAKGATIDEKRNRSVITTLPSDSPYGSVGWHSESLSIRVAEPKENVTILQLRIVREKGLFGDLAIHLIAKPNFLLHTNNQAIENEDFVLQETILIMKENIRETYAKVAILPDDTPELEEGFVVAITEVNLVNSDFSTEQPRVRRPGMEIAEITIEENDDPRGIFMFFVTRDVGGVITAQELPSPLGVLHVPVVRLAGSFGAVNVYWKATPDSASLEDFKPSHGTLKFADGQVTAMIEITIIDDAQFELTEKFNVSLVSVAGGGRLGDDVVVTVIIPQNDSPFGIFGFEEQTVMVDESLLSDDPESHVTLTVVRSAGGKGAVQLQWTVEEKAKDDLSPLNGTLHFDETESRKTIVLHTLQDTVLEADRHFTIQLLSIDEVEISPIKGSASIIIRGERGALGEVGIAPSSRHVLIGEPSAKYNGTAVISLLRGPVISGEVTVFWKILPPSVGEFAETSGELMMRDGQSTAIVMIQALNDDVPEEKQFYEFQLTGVSEGGVLSDSRRTSNLTMAASDSPYGRFAFAHKQLQVLEAAQRVNVTVIRSGGHFGLVRLWYETVSGTAVADLDFIFAAGELLFQETEMVKSLHVEILDDDYPEGPEEFSLVIRKVELQGRGYDFTIQENGLQIDQPPEIGNISVVRIIIVKNDNAEGVIEFDPMYTAFKVEKDVRTISIPVVRLHGTYGLVTAEVTSQSSSAAPGGVGYVLLGSTVVFQHGQNLSFINVSITDDSESEFEEPIEILLTGATGGASLGRHLVSRITIAESESPLGVVRFLNDSKISVPNPNSTLTLSLVLERTGRLLGEVQVNWKIVGPNSQETLPPQNKDIADPVSGSFYFGEGEGGMRTLILTIYPHEEIEVEETFIVKLKIGKGEAKLDSRAKDVMLTIQKFGDPNGVVHFAPDSLSKKTYSEPEALEGPLVITFFVRRVKGTFGEITVSWELSSEFDVTGDFLATQGWFTIADGESEASFDVYLLPDEVPETEEDYAIQLVSVEGGAELDLEKCITWFSVSANDDPHGVFALYSDHQSILIGQNLIRSIQINVTRLAGTFGDVTVRFRISSDHKEQPIATEYAERELLVKDGARYKVDMVPIKNQVFLSLGSNFTLRLVTVMLVSGSFSGMPTILQEAKSAVLPIPEEAANSQVGFESTAFQLTNITAGTSQVVISRRGTYGSLSVAWTSGYAPGFEIPEFIVVGNMTPTLGSLSFSHGERRKGALLWTFPTPGRPEAFVIHLSGVRSSAPGGAQLRSGFTVAEIEPMGVFQFSPSSRNITVSEDTHRIRLHIQRLFGFRSDLTRVSYETTAGSAKPLEDFEPIQNGEMFFHKFQTEVDFEITLINDQLPEMQEFFYVNLTSVEMRGLRKLDESWRPRLNLEFSVAVITILDDDLAGPDVSLPTTAVALTVDTTLIPVETDSTTHPSTSKITAILQATDMVSIVTEAASIPATPGKLVTLHGTSALPEKPSATTVTANVSIHGTFGLWPRIVYVEEEMKNGTFNTADILIRRTGGVTGNVSVTVRTFGERCAQKEPNALPFQDIYGASNLTWAVEDEDFEEQNLILTFLEGERERNMSVPILDDDEPEGQEFFYVFLTDPQGGAQTLKGQDEAGFSAFTMVIIAGSDLHNGIIGFSEESQRGLQLGEGADMRRLRLVVTRQPNRAFEDVQVFWRVTFNKTGIILQKEGVDLIDGLVSVSGSTACRSGQTRCFISLELKPEKVPPVEMQFFVELYEVTTGAAINNSARFAQIKVLRSDEPRSLLYFSVGSRLAVAHKKSTLVTLQVARDSGTNSMMSVNFSTQELRSTETIGRTLISPAISGKDFVKTEGTLVFEPGQRSTMVDVILTPETGSSSPFPKRFQIVLFDPKGGARVDKAYGTANITLVSDADAQAIWGLADQLQQPLDEDILNRVLHSINLRVATENTDEQLSAVMHLIEKISAEGRNKAFSIKSRTLFYEILCALINPKRQDTRGFSHFTEVAENFAFSLLTDITCGSPGEKSKTILDSCPYLSILALHWYPQQINGHKFEGKEGDYIRIPETLLDVSDAEIMPGKSTCKLIQFTEYSSQQWFVTENNLPALKNKVLSLSMKGQSSQPLTNNNEVLYRIYAAEPRIVPQTSLCLLWNQAAASWLPDSQFCKVVEDTSDHVECACSHMSVYAVYAQTDSASPYNEAFFSSGFICISGLCLAILSHIFCARYSMFAAKLLTHMMAASLATQIMFLASAYVSPQLTEEGCSAVAAVTHYLYLCQFSWMLIQSVNFWYVLVMNDEHTERRYLLFFLLSWGLPSFVVILLIVILRGIYSQSMPQIYGLVHSDLCFIPNVYAALFTAALVPLMCLVVVFVVFIHAYQVKSQWKAYDDVFRGRTNAAEIPLILYLFALISMTWLWGGLHMAYRHFWMLILFVIFNSLQGLYVFVVYFILHNQTCCPMKASYTVEMNGHPGPSTAFFTPGSGMPPAGGEISKSTQNLISAMEEVPPDWERGSIQQASQASPDLKTSPQNGTTFPSPAGYGQGSLIADEESQEFDDLIFALKTGAGLSVSDNESGHDSQEGGTLTDSQIVELRRIPIADTHL